MRLLGEGIYAAIYEFTLGRWRENEEMASFMAAVGLGGAMIFNVMLVILSAITFLGPLVFVPKRVLEVLTISPMVIPFVLFVRHNRYVEVVRRFRRRSLAQQHRAKLVAWTYVVLSLAAPLLVGLGLARR